MKRLVTLPPTTCSKEPLESLFALNIKMEMTIQISTLIIFGNRAYGTDSLSKSDSLTPRHHKRAS